MQRTDEAVDVINECEYQTVNEVVHERHSRKKYCDEIAGQQYG